MLCGRGLAWPSSWSPISARWVPGSGGFEKFDDVAGGVLQQDLLAAGAGQDVVAKRRALGAEAGDFGFEIADDEMDAVPAAGAGLGAVGHRASGGALRAAEQQAQVAARDIGER